jgi:hypothetical protein
LYQPTNDVQHVVQEVLGKINQGEQLVGVHFRAQWFGTHHACGCLDPYELPRCMMNFKHVMQERNISAFENNRRLRFFVASDETAGINAFREAFGQEVLTLPDVLPLEHSLSVSAAGAKRLLAEFLILSKSAAILGTCGSTFTEGVMRLSGLKAEALITTGTEAARACAALNRESGHRLKSSFDFVRFSESRSWKHSCSCYGDDAHINLERRGGICKFACNRSPQPPHCPKLTLLQADKISSFEKPAWMPQEFGVL